jgi:hypothetical protein
MSLFKEVDPGDTVTTRFDGTKRKGTVYEVKQYRGEPPTCDICVYDNEFQGRLILKDVPVADVKQTPGSKIRRGILAVFRALAG